MPSLFLLCQALFHEVLLDLVIRIKEKLYEDCYDFRSLLSYIQGGQYKLILDVPIHLACFSISCARSCLREPVEVRRTNKIYFRPQFQNNSCRREHVEVQYVNENTPIS